MNKVNQGEQGDQSDQNQQGNQSGDDQGEEGQQDGQSGESPEGESEDGETSQGGESGGESGEGDELSQGPSQGAGSGTGEGETDGEFGEGGVEGGDLDDTRDLNIPEDLMDNYKQTGEITAPEDVDEGDPDAKLQDHEQDMKDSQRDAKKIEEIKKQRGTGSGGGAYSNVDYSGMFEEKARIPWNQIINEFLTQNERSATTYRRPSRRMAGINFSDFYADQEEELIMPDRYDEKLNELMLIVDVSGSNQKAANSVFPEITEAINSSGFGKESALRLVSFNSDVEDEYIFTFLPKEYQSLKHLYQKVPEEKIIIPSEGDQLVSDKDINRFQWRIGGGTRISPVFEALETLREKPPFIVVLTDGEFNQQDLEMIRKGNFSFKVIWILTNDYYLKYNGGQELRGYKTYNLYEMDY